MDVISLPSIFMPCGHHFCLGCITPLCKEARDASYRGQETVVPKCPLCRHLCPELVQPWPRATQDMTLERAVENGQTLLLSLHCGGPVRGFVYGDLSWRTRASGTGQYSTTGRMAMKVCGSEKALLRNMVKVEAEMCGSHRDNVPDEIAELYDRCTVCGWCFLLPNIRFGVCRSCWETVPRCQPAPFPGRPLSPLNLLQEGNRPASTPDPNTTELVDFTQRRKCEGCGLFMNPLRLNEHNRCRACAEDRCEKCFIWGKRPQDRFACKECKPRKVPIWRQMRHISFHTRTVTLPSTGDAAPPPPTQPESPPTPREPSPDLADDGGAVEPPGWDEASQVRRNAVQASDGAAAAAATATATAAATALVRCERCNGLLPDPWPEGPGLRVICDECATQVRRQLGRVQRVFDRQLAGHMAAAAPAAAAPAAAAAASGDRYIFRCERCNVELPADRMREDMCEECQRQMDDLDRILERVLPVETTTTDAAAAAPTRTRYTGVAEAAELMIAGVGSGWTTAAEVMRERTQAGVTGSWRPHDRQPLPQIAVQHGITLPRSEPVVRRFCCRCGVTFTGVWTYNAGDVCVACNENPRRLVGCANGACSNYDYANRMSMGRCQVCVQTDRQRRYEHNERAAVQEAIRGTLQLHLGALQCDLCAQYSHAREMVDGRCERCRTHPEARIRCVICDRLTKVEDLLCGLCVSCHEEALWGL